MPGTPRGWFSWAVSVLEYGARPHSAPLEIVGWTDRRCRYAREDALSVKIIAERASAKCSRNCVGFDLMRRYYTEGASWFSFTEWEQWILRKTIGEFSRRLRAAGYLQDQGGDARPDI